MDQMGKLIKAKLLIDYLKLGLETNQIYTNVTKFDWFSTCTQHKSRGFTKSKQVLFYNFPNKD